MAGPKRRRVERKVYFYRMEIRDKNAEPMHVDLKTLLGTIDEMGFGPTGRHWEDNEGNATCCWPERLDSPQRLRIGNVRRSALPQVERAGRIRSLKISAEAGLLEAMHVVFFGEGIVGSVFNFYGPRMPRLARYLEQKCGGLCPQVEFNPLFRKDMLEQLNRLSAIRLVRLRIKAPFSEIVRQADEDLGESFAAAERATGGQEVEIVARPAGRARAGLSQRLLGAVRSLAGRQDDNMREAVSKFTVQGYESETGSLETLDLLNDYMISRKRIALSEPPSKALVPKSAYLAIEQAYQEMREELRDAAGLSPK